MRRIVGGPAIVLNKIYWGACILCVACTIYDNKKQ